MTASFNAGGVYVDVVPDFTKFNSKVASELGKIGDQIGRKIGDSIPTKDLNAKLKELGDSAGRLGDKLTRKLTLPAAAGFAVAIKSASDLNEQVSATGVVFGKSADRILDLGENASKTLGQSNRAALTAANGFGSLFKTIGLTDEVSADYSETLVKLGGDLASFKDTSPEEAVQALSSALIGESEPIRKYGVLLDDASLKLKAVSMGLIGTTTEVLPPAGRAQAAYALILEQTTLAQGDLARTSDSVANRTRIAKASLEDAAASIGTQLLPIAASAAQKVSALAQGFAELSPATQKVVLGVGALALAAGPAAKAVQGVADASRLAVKGYKELSEASGGVKVAAVGSVAALALVGAVLAQNAASAAKAKKEIDALAKPTGPNSLDALRESGNRLNVEMGKLRSSGMANDLGVLRGSLKEFGGAIGVTNDKMNDYRARVEAVTEAAGKHNAAFSMLKGNLDTVAKQYGVTADEAGKLATKAGVDLSKALDKTSDGALRKTKEELDRSTIAGDKLADAGGKIGDKFQTAEDKLKGFSDALAATLTPGLEVEKLQLRVAEQTERLAKAYAEAGGKAGLQTEKGRELKGQLIDLVGTLQEQIVKQAEASGQTFNAAEAQKQLIAKLEEQKRKFPGLRSEIDSYIAKIKLIPSSAPTTAVFDSAQARREVLEWEHWAKGRDVAESDTVTFSNLQARATPHRAEGGPVRAGMPVWTGERGPEAFIPATDGFILSTEDGRRAAAKGMGGGGSTFNVYPQSQDVHGIAREVADEASWLSRLGGR